MKMELEDSNLIDMPTDVTNLQEAYIKQDEVPIKMEPGSMSMASKPAPRPLDYFAIKSESESEGENESSSEQNTRGTEITTSTLTSNQTELETRSSMVTEETYVKVELDSDSSLDAINNGNENEEADEKAPKPKLKSQAPKPIKYFKIKTPPASESSDEGKEAENEKIDKVPLKLTNLQLKAMQKYSKLIGSDLKTKVRMNTMKDNTVYNCLVCDSKFKALESIRGHLSQHREGNPFRCPKTDCCKLYPTHALLTQHVKGHSARRRFKCEICSFKLFSKNNLKKHMLTHTKEKPFQCQVCERRFANTGNLKSHLLIHSKTREKTFKCGACDMRFLSKIGWTHHVNRHKGVLKIKRFSCYMCGVKKDSPSSIEIHLGVHTLEKPFKCPQCKIRLKSSITLKNHMRVHMNTELFECPHCWKKFKWKNDLMSHFKLTHDKANVPEFQCEFEGCDYKTVRVKDMRRHKNNIHLKALPFDCVVCSKKFGEKYALDKHVMLHHTDVRPYKCDLCPRGFVTNSALAYHKRTHSEEKRFPCHLCDMKYKSSMGRAMHLKGKHGIGSITRDCNCYFCNKLYHGYSGYLKHLRNHTREKPYQCNEPDCKIWIKSAETLKYHLQVKHGKGKPPKIILSDERFQCGQCPRSYSLKRSLLDHVKIAHNEAAPIYKCKKCKHETRNKTSLKLHNRAVHLNIKYKCTKCEKEYKKTQDLRKHYEKFHSDD